MQSRSSWNLYFLFLSIFNIWSLIIFWCYGSGKQQEWATPSAENIMNNDKSAEEKPESTWWEFCMIGLILYWLKVIIYDADEIVMPHQWILIIIIFFFHWIHKKYPFSSIFISFYLIYLSSSMVTFHWSFFCKFMKFKFNQGVARL